MTNDRKTHDAVVADWQANAKSRDKENYLFLRQVKQRVPASRVDRIALELHQEAFATVDCTKCANCCRTLRVVVTDEDIPRIAGHLRTTVEDFIASYLERDEDDGGYHIRTKPCPFLGEDNLCKIYDVRPEKCRGYPFTDKPDFVFMTMTHANNALVCPAVFHIVEQMKRQLGR
jgi:Fe-S-cluster containining protein